MLKRIKAIKNIKLKVVSIFLLITLMSLQLSPFMLNATASQLEFYSPGLVTPATDVAYNKNVFYTKATLGGDTAYCIDYGRGLPSGTMTYYKQLSAQGVAILVYGYPNTSAAEMGCASDDEAYMATQMAFWTVMMKTGESEGPQTFNLDNIYAKPGYEEFMQRAAAAAKKLNARAVADPYIPNPTLKLDTSAAKLVNKNGEVITGPYVVNVTGGTVSSIKASLSNAPSSAKIVDANGNAKTSFANGESVYVKFSETEEGSTMTLNVKADTNKVVGSIYTGSSTSQNFVKLDTVPVELLASANIKWGTQTGSIEVLKVDQNDDPVSGVKFELRDTSGNKLAEGTTGEDGYIKFSNVKAGEYKLVEVSAPEGYIMGDKPLEFTVKAGETFKIEVENEKVTGTLEIKKVDEDGNPIPNVTFEILNEEREKIAEVTTDENGKAKVSNLKLGKYYYREISAPVNVIMDKTLREFSITETNKNVVKTITNEKVKGSLKIVKVDENNNPVEGVTFEVLNSDKKVIEKITTNASGIAVSKDLTPGTYYYKEVSGPSNIIIDETVREFKVSTSGEVIEKKVVNKLAKGQIEILKVDENKTPISGVKFEILDSNKKVVDTITTDKNGKAISKALELGTYYYKEIEAPSNVVMDTAEYEFKLTSNGQIVTKTVINENVKGSLNIVKVDENNTPVPGVKFEILDVNKKVIDTIITDKDGKASSKNLPVGTYYYKEISGPANIIVDTTTYMFKLTETNKVVAKTIVNKLVKGHLEILKVDENNIPISGVKFEILDSNKKVVDTITTDKNGKATSKDLNLGTYYYKEIEAPSNVVMDTTEYKFSLTTSAKIVTKTVVNKLAEGSLKIIKVDENNVPLEGVTFNILDENKNIIDTITTNSEGIAQSKELEMGTYYYQEISAPEGIIVDSTIYKFVISKDGQNVIKTMVNNYAKGQLEILKVDENSTPISGVKFQILDNNKNVVDELTTDENGKAISKKLVLETYYYKEIEAPSNVVMDTTEYEFKLTENNQVIKKTVINRNVVGNLVIIKVDEDNKPLEGVKFEILDVNKKLVETIVTDKEGKATSSKLAIGTYYYKEIEAPSNVVIDSTEYKFKITETNTVITKKVVNKLSEGKLKIIKVDENNIPLEGVTFNILDSDKNIIDTIITNSEGIAESKELKNGTYYYQEISAPDGIIVDSTMYKFVISKNGQNVIKNMVNNYAKGKLEIIKVDENNTPIEGVKFNILDENKNIVDTIVTDKEGIATSKKLVLGTYYYKEVEAPSNVIMDTTEHEFKLTENNQIITKKVVNKLSEGSLKIIKVDENNVPLEGVTFNILDSNKNIIDTITTNSEGIAQSKELKLGTYYYQEVSAPEGIIVDNTMYKFVISENGQNVIKNMVNNYAKGQLEIIKVDENNTPIEGVKFNILDENKNIVDTIVTDKEGKTTSKKLVLGTYYYKEVEAPSNVIMDTTEHEFKLTENNQIITKKVVNKLSEGSLKIIKVDENNVPLEGVTFNILDSNKNIIDTITTNSEGIAQSKELKLGTYYYQEVSAPEGIIVDNTMYKFVISENGQNVIKNMVNNYAKGQLEIIKVDENNTPIEGVKFNILDENKNIVDTIVTDKEGKTTSKKLVCGKYYYQEVEAPEKYVIDTKEYVFKITENNQIITKKVVNKLSEGSLKIIKVDENNVPLEGVTFNILDSDKNIIDTIITNSEGIAESKELILGTYYYQEISAPEGIIVDNTMYKFVISENGQNVIKNMVNNYAKGQLEIIKLDEKDAPIEGVKFNILDADGNIVDEIITGADGKALTKALRLGIYYYQEIEAPEKYAIDSNIYEFNISKNNQVISKIVINIEKYGNLQILKLDKDTKNPIAGVVFNIVDSDGNIVDTITTDENGIAVSKNLVLGTYTFYEVSAPNGYIIDNNVYEFKLTKHQQIKDLKVYNEKEKLPVTGGIISTDMMIIICVTLISIFGYSLMTVLEDRKEQ